MENIKLTDLVDMYVLQELQNAINERSDIAAAISQVDGTNLTNPTAKQSDFCQVYTKGTEEGLRRCNRCDSENARRARESGVASCYKCHAGLYDFSAPIVANDEYVGFVVGGQVLEKPLEREYVYALADELGIDREAYWTAAQKLPIVSKERMDEVLDNIQKTAHIISDIATNKYQVMLASKEIEAAAKMKSDFLANMSHEIRTPMNAVIGMADMALREELSADARKYITQIKNSGKTLLAIINDILDFSKIEAGKMDITLSTYSPYEIIDEVAGIISTRIKDKKFELIVDISPEIPRQLMGDAVRIKQIIINLANNAVKFTSVGKVTITAGSKKLEDKTQELFISVRDTGIGIKEEDLKKIFESFQQVDSKRNRNIEGTGLGLAISKQLIELMGGKLEVHSEYEVGSEFSFRIPQLQLADSIRLSVENADSVRVLALIANSYVSQQLCKDVTDLSGEFQELNSISQVKAMIEKGYTYLFVDETQYKAYIEDNIEEYSDISIVLLLDFNSEYKAEYPNLKILRKPVSLYQLYMLFNNKTITYANDEDYVADFSAPDAEILIVDDNEVNIQVAVGLLEPLEMKIDTALSGRQALEKIEHKHYDLILMDHMMPEMDGIETTHTIRNLHQDYDNVPIIALTANALEDSKAMFLCEGMNDFVTKPIEVKTLTETVRSWLPPSKVIPIDFLSRDTVKKDIPDIPNIPELDIKSALKLVGRPKLLCNIIENYSKAVGRKSHSIEEAWKNRDIDKYTIEVHALKSTSRQIGAIQIGDLAASLEQAGNQRDLALIESHTGELLESYRNLGIRLKEYFPDAAEQDSEHTISPEMLVGLLDKFKNAIDELDSTGMEDIVKELRRYYYSDEERALLDKMKLAVEDLDIDTCYEAVYMWSEKYAK